nr:MAG TPA: hypothetical protein [Caudoviricetes sp.]
MATTTLTGSCSTTGLAQSYNDNSVARQGYYAPNSKAPTVCQNSFLGHIKFTGSIGSNQKITAATLSVTTNGAGKSSHTLFLTSPFSYSISKAGHNKTHSIPVSSSSVLSSMTTAFRSGSTFEFQIEDESLVVGSTTTTNDSSSGGSYSQNYLGISSASLSITYETEATTYTITYDAGTDGILNFTPTTQSATEGSTITLKPASGDAKPTKPNSTTNTYINYNINYTGGTNTVETVVRTTKYSFYNWSGSDGNTYTGGSSHVMTANLTLIATYTTAEITFSSVTLPSKTRDGYNFLGWYTSATGGTKVGDAGDSYTPTSNASTIYAHWEQQTIQTYTITYTGNGGTVSNLPTDQTKTKGVALTLSSSIPTRATEDATTGYTVTYNYNGVSCNGATSDKAADKRSYTFKNWNTNSGGSGTVYQPGGTFNTDADTTLYAQWSSNIIDGPVILPTPSGYSSTYTFNGWYTAASGGTRIGGGGSSYTPTTNTTLYAQWSTSGGTTSYYIIYQKNAPDTSTISNIPATQTKTQGLNITLSSVSPSRSDPRETRTVTFNYGSVMNNKTETKSCYVTYLWQFNKWNTSANGSGTTYSPGEVYSIDSDLVLYAQWRISQTKHNATEVPVPTGYPSNYTFLGWYTSQTGGTRIEDEYYAPQTANDTLYARFVERYNVIYHSTTDNESNIPAQQYKEKDVALTLSSDVPQKLSVGGTETSNYVSFNYGDNGSGDTNQITISSATVYTFKYWTTTATDAEPHYTPGSQYTTNAALDLYSQWSEAVAADHITLPTPTVSAGYTFLGWYDAVEGGNYIGVGGNKYQPTLGVNSTFYAHYEKSTVEVYPTDGAKFYCGDNNNLARQIKKMYVGVEITKPIYEITSTTHLTGNTFSNFFTAVTTASYGWTLSFGSTDIVKCVPQNFGKDSTTATTILTVVPEDGVSGIIISGKYYTESNFDKLSITLSDGTKVLDAVSGTQSTQTVWLSGKTLKKGDTITLTYTKDSSNSDTQETSTFVEIKCDPIYTYNQTGTETKELAKLAKRAYKGTKSGRAMLWYDASSSSAIKYTGDMALTENITIDNNLYNLYTLTSSGTLTLYGNAQYWACGGGAGGASSSNYAGGGGGGGGYFVDGTIGKGTYAVSIAGGSATDTKGESTSIGDAITADGGKKVSTYDGGNGGSGGGFSYYAMSDGVSSGTGGAGCGSSTIPFASSNITIETINFPHCAGGGGGQCGRKGYSAHGGGTGGSNGAKATGSSTNYTGGVGGEKGGGRGGSYNMSSYAGSVGGDATFYGAGGGGAARGGVSGSYIYAGGVGYQGVVYILIKK